MNKLLLLSTAMLLSATVAQASNQTVENALKSRPELSSFYRGLVNTGVLSELQPDRSYTIFAPTDAAMARLTPEQYPCFYSTDCRGEVASILRNHIVPQQLTFNGPVNGTVFSLDRTPVSLAEPSKNYFTAGGAHILSQYQLSGNVLYTLDGVIATPQELADLTVPRVIEVPVASLEPTPVPVARTVTERVYYSPEGRPDGVSQTTVIDSVYSVAPSR